ncbi:MAG: hypothetical protein IBX56_07695 [Methylomicrobium sp.]|nr:hypothetical protein [Methylomicrobium sp.]
MINGHEINGAEINGDAGQAESGPLIISLGFEIIIADALAISASVVLNAVLPVSLMAPIEVVSNLFQTVGQSVTWSVSIFLNDVDYSARLTGSISVERQVGGSALADISIVHATGPIDPTAFDGQTVAIFYSDARGQSLLFKGVVIRSRINMSDGLLALSCSDLLQEFVDELSRGQIDALIDHARVDTVYRDPINNWDYVQQCLKSAEGDLFRSVNGPIRFVPWSVAPGVTHDDSVILANSLEPNFQDRHTLVNQVDIEFNWRHFAGWHRIHNIKWGVGIHYNKWVVTAFSSLPPREMIERSIPGGLVLTKADYVDAPPTGLYRYMFAQAVFNNLSPGFFAFACDINAVERWLQTITHNVNISFSAPDSIARYGAIAKNASYALSGDEGGIDWHQTVESPDLPRGLEFLTQMGAMNTGPRVGHRSQPPSGFDVTVYNHLRGQTYRVPLYSQDSTPNSVDAALVCALREARKSILETHQNVAIDYEVPLSPLLELAHGIEIDADSVSSTGRITALRHRLDIDSGEAITRLTVTPYANIDAPSLSAPVLQSAAPETVSLSHPQLQNHFGFPGVVPAEPDEEWRGYVGNFADHSTYPESFTVEIPAVNEALRDALEINQSVDYTLDINMNKVSLTL